MRRRKEEVYHRPKAEFRGSRKNRKILELTTRTRG
jgi:hypothetical protein